MIVQAMGTSRDPKKFSLEMIKQMGTFLGKPIAGYPTTSMLDILGGDEEDIQKLRTKFEMSLKRVTVVKRA